MGRFVSGDALKQVKRTDRVGRPDIDAFEGVMDL
jgi:hypothetical protein